MILASEILSKNFKGKKLVKGFRYRCPVPSCARCEVIMIKTEEVSDFATDHHWPRTIKKLGYPRQ
jgi:hypothetical protein